MGGGGTIKPMEGGEGMTTFEKAKRALRGRITGAAAQGVNVLALVDANHDELPNGKWG